MPREPRGGPRGEELAYALAFSIVLTATLFYLTFEVPALLDRLLLGYFPDVFYDAEAVERALGTLRPFGCSALVATIALIALGFAARRRGLTLLGSLALYAPTFGYFALAMFFLAGLGVLRALWLPILELSPSVLKLGCVVYLPLSIVPHAPLVGMAIALAGLLVFSLGVTAWLYGRFKGYELVDFWVYRYSRHPQYLGFVVWSYGLLVFVSYKTYVRGALTTPPALIWLASTMIVVAAALLEELEMLRRYGERYEEYRRRTPFMIPSPKLVTELVTSFAGIAGGRLRSAKDVAIAVSVCAIVLIALSYALMLMSLC